MAVDSHRTRRSIEARTSKSTGAAPLAVSTASRLTSAVVIVIFPFVGIVVEQLGGPRFPVGRIVRSRRAGAGVHQQESMRERRLEPVVGVGQVSAGERLDLRQPIEE